MIERCHCPHSAQCINPNLFRLAPLSLTSTSMQLSRNPSRSLEGSGRWWLPTSDLDENMLSHRTAPAIPDIQEGFSSEHVNGTPYPSYTFCLRKFSHPITNPCKLSGLIFHLPLNKRPSVQPSLYPDPIIPRLWLSEACLMPVTQLLAVSQCKQQQTSDICCLSAPWQYQTTIGGE